MVVGLLSCDKDDTGTISGKGNRLVRVSQISGNNETWGNFVLKMEYKNDQLVGMSRYDTNGREKGGFLQRKKKERLPIVYWIMYRL